MPPRAGAPSAGPPVPHADVGQVFGAFPKALGLSFKTVIGPYLIFGLAAFLLVSAPVSVLQYLRFQALMEGALTRSNVLNYVGLAFSFLGIFIAVPSFGLSRALRTAMVEGPAAVSGFGGAMRAAFSRYLQLLGNLFLVGIGLTLGAVFCVLPFFAGLYFFLMAPYLVASCGEDAWSGIVRSSKMALRNVGSFIALAAIMVVVALVTAGVSFGLTAALTPALGVGVAQLVSQGVASLLGLPVGYFMWVLAVSSFVVIETTETETPLQL